MFSCVSLCCELAVCVRERGERGSAHMLHTREKQTKRFAALSEHQHARMRLGRQCMHALVLCVWPDHACLLGKRPAQGCDVAHTRSPRSSRRRPCTLVERLAAVRVVAQPDRQGQLGKADGRRVGLVGWALALELEIASKVGRKGRLLLSMLAVSARGPNHESRSRAPRALGSRRR